MGKQNVNQNLLIGHLVCWLLRTKGVLVTSASRHFIFDIYPGFFYKYMLHKFHFIYRFNEFKIKPCIASIKQRKNSWKKVTPIGQLICLLNETYGMEQTRALWIASICMASTGVMLEIMVKL